MRTLGYLCGLALVLLAVGVLGAACAAPQPAGPAAKVRMTIAGHSVGGTTYFVAGGLSRVLNKYLPEVYATVESVSSAGEHAVLLNKGEIDLAVNPDAMMAWAYKGEAEFKDRPHPNLRTLVGAYFNENTLMTLKGSGIKSIYELKGKKVGIGPRGGMMPPLNFPLLKAHGLTEKDFEARYLTIAEIITALKDGTIDAGFTTAGRPQAGVVDLTTTHQVVFLGIDPNAPGVKEFQKEYPYFPLGKIPAGTYKGVDKDTDTVFSSIHLHANKNLSEELAYKITKVVNEYSKEGAEVHPLVAEFKPDNLFSGLSLPVHKGAIRYYKEIGLWDKRPADIPTVED